MVESHHLLRLQLELQQLLPMVGKCTSACASWDEGNAQVLIQFLQGSLAMAGDGINFKQATWNAVAEHMVPFTTEGGMKTAKVCKNKFT